MLDYSPVEVSSHRFVLVVLAEFAKPDGWDSWPSVGTITKRTRYGERTVQGALKDLEAGGHIEQTGTQANGCRIWRIVMDRGEDFHAANWAGEHEHTRPRANPVGGRNGCAPAESAPPADAAPPRSSRAPTPAGSAPEPPEPPVVDEHSDVLGGSHGSPAAAAPPQMPHPAGSAGVTSRLEFAWPRVRQRLAERVNAAQGAIYFDELALTQGDLSWVVLTAPSPAIAQRLNADWLATISDVFAEVTAVRPNIHIVAADDPQAEADWQRWLAATSAEDRTFLEPNGKEKVDAG